jgi:branched-chain amino acid aminotransferase
VFWYDGSLRESASVEFDLRDRGLTLGDGVFDTSLARNGCTFRRKAHLDRLIVDAEILAIPFPETTAAQALDKLAAAVGDGAVRLTLTRGAGPRGLPLPKDPRPILFGVGIPQPRTTTFPVLTLSTTPIRRNETSPVSRVKALPYLDGILAYEEAKQRGADEVLFENTRGHVACLASANIFAVFGQHLVTPPVGDGVLAGTTRAFVITKARDLGYEVTERSLGIDKFSRAEAIFATSSLRLIAPCRSLDAMSFDSAENEIVKRLQVAIRDAVVEECGRL